MFQVHVYRKIVNNTMLISEMMSLTALHQTMGHEDEIIVRFKLHQIEPGK
jgi:hypothetical protein